MQVYEYFVLIIIIGELRHFTGDEDVDTYLPRLSEFQSGSESVKSYIERAKDILQGQITSLRMTKV